MVGVSGDLGQPVPLGVNASDGFEGDLEVSQMGGWEGGEVGKEPLAEVRREDEPLTLPQVWNVTKMREGPTVGFSFRSFLD